MQQHEWDLEIFILSEISLERETYDISYMESKLFIKQKQTQTENESQLSYVIRGGGQLEFWD